MRGFRFSIVMFILTIGFVFPPDTAWGLDPGKPILILPNNPAQPNYNPSHEISLACYDYDEDTDKWLPTSCRMEVTLTEGTGPLVPPTDPGPGHVHNGGGKPLGKIRVVDTGTEYDNLVIDIDSETMIEYMSPEVAGVVLLEATATFPNGSSCLPRPECSRTLEFYVRFYRRFLFTAFYLGRLPDESPIHKVIRDPVKSLLHPEGTYATWDTLDMLQEIANEYTRTTEAFLSVNDMSLPWGGLFDIDGNWQPDHKEHRTGTDVDINRAPLIIISPPIAADAINCGVDEYFGRAVKRIADKYKSIYPRVRCEPGYDENNVFVKEFKKHIDFY